MLGQFPASIHPLALIQAAADIEGGAGQRRCLEDRGDQRNAKPRSRSGAAGALVVAATRARLPHLGEHHARRG